MFKCKCKCKDKEVTEVQNVLTEEAKKDKKICKLTMAVCFLAGLVLGFLISPVKKGCTIGSNNVINHTEGADGNDEEEREERDPDEIPF